MKLQLNFFFSDKRLLVGFTILLVIIILSLLGSLVIPYNPIESDLSNALLPPSLTHPFGTDHMGRDLFVRILAGLKMSLTFIVPSVLLSAGIGTILGVVAGYYGGIIDEVIYYFVNLMLSLPILILALMFVGFFGFSVLNLFVVLVLSLWVLFARVSRNVVLSLKEEGFIEGLKAIGAGSFYLITKHLIPNSLAPIIALTTTTMGVTFIIVSSLCFLGVGVQPPTPECGLILREGMTYMRVAPWLVIFPSIFITFTVAGFILVGDSLRDLLDPKARFKLRKFLL